MNVVDKRHNAMTLRRDSSVRGSALYQDNM